MFYAIYSDVRDRCVLKLVEGDVLYSAVTAAIRNSPHVQQTTSPGPNTALQHHQPALAGAQAPPASSALYGSATSSLQNIPVYATVTSGGGNAPAQGMAVRDAAASHPHNAHASPTLSLQEQRRFYGAAPPSQQQYASPRPLSADSQRYVTPSPHDVMLADRLSYHEPSEPRSSGTCTPADDVTRSVARLRTVLL